MPKPYQLISGIFSPTVTQTNLHVRATTAVITIRSLFPDRKHKESKSMKEARRWGQLQQKEGFCFYLAPYLRVGTSSPVVHLPASRVHITPEVPFWQMLLWLHHGAFGAYSQQSWCPSPPRNSPRILGVFLKVAQVVPFFPIPSTIPGGE